MEYRAALRLRGGQGDMASTFGTRLREARKRAKLSGPAVAKHLGVSAQTVSFWDRDVNFPEVAKLIEISELIGIKVDWLLTGKDGPSEGLAGVVGRIVPKVTAQELANFTPTAEQIANISRGRVLTHFPCGPKSFQITLWDRSNSPAFDQGDSVVIDPDVRPEPGDMVLAVVDGAALFRRYRPRGEQVELAPLNPDWNTVTCKLEGKARLLGTMSEHSRQRRS